MKLDKATSDAIRDILEGRSQSHELSPITRRMLEVVLLVSDNCDELEAMRAARSGDPSALSVLIETGVDMQFPDTRAFVAAKVRGDNGRRKKADDLVLYRIQAALRILDYVHGHGLNQAQAIRKFMDDGHATSPSFDTVKSDFTRGREELRSVFETLGLPIGEALQKS